MRGIPRVTVQIEPFICVGQATIPRSRWPVRLKPLPREACLSYCFPQSVQ